MSTSSPARRELAYGALVIVLGAVGCYATYGFNVQVAASQILGSWRTFFRHYSSTLLWAGFGVAMATAIAILIAGWWGRRKNGARTKPSFTICATVGAVLIFGGALPYFIKGAILQQQSASTYSTSP